MLLVRHWPGHDYYSRLSKVTIPSPLRLMLVTRSSMVPLLDPEVA
jgi:hypothetical protein